MSTDIRTEPIFSLNPSELFDEDTEYRHLCRLFEKQFGEGIFGPSKKTVTYASRRLARRLSYLNPFRKTGYTEVYQNKNGIKITLDVQQFKVGELSIKLVDQCVVIEGKHKDRRDYHGFVSRSFTRKYFLPKSMDPSTLSAKLSLDGLLTVTAISKDLPAPKVRVIDICCTRKTALAPNTQLKGPARLARKPGGLKTATPKPVTIKLGAPKPTTNPATLKPEAAEPTVPVKKPKTASTSKPKAQKMSRGTGRPLNSGNAMSKSQKQSGKT